MLLTGDDGLHTPTRPLGPTVASVGPTPRSKRLIVEMSAAARGNRRMREGATVPPKNTGQIVPVRCGTNAPFPQRQSRRAGHWHATWFFSMYDVWMSIRRPVGDAGYKNSVSQTEVDEGLAAVRRTRVPGCPCGTGLSHARSTRPSISGQYRPYRSPIRPGASLADTGSRWRRLPLWYRRKARMGTHDVPSRE